MGYPSIIATYILIGMGLGVLVQHLFLVVRKNNGLLHLNFSLFIASVLLFHYAVMNSTKTTELTEFLFFYKLALVFSQFALLMLVFFAESYIHRRMLGIRRLIIGLFLIGLPIHLMRETGLVMDTAGELQVIVNILGEPFYQFFNLEEPGVFAPLYLFFVIITNTYVIVLAVYARRSGEKRKGAQLLAAILLFAKGIVFDFLFISKIFPVLPLSGFYVIGFIIIMSIELHDRVLKSISLENEAKKNKKIDRLKSRFIADISHEFRTPLTLILGPFEKVLTKIKDREVRNDLHTMQRNAYRMQQLVEQLLHAVCIEAKRLPLRASPQDIEQRIREWVASFASLGESRGISLKLHLPESPIEVFFDAEKLEKVIFNLVGNAFKFTLQGGEITITVRQIANKSTNNSPGTIECTIGDTGIGIAQEHLPHIFDRFYRAGKVQAGEQGGTGIGLALAKEFVELHHGNISAESTLGKGTTFTVSLPLGSEHLSADEIADEFAGNENADQSPKTNESQSAAIGSSDNENPAPATKSGPRILVVEDNNDMRRYLRNCLISEFEVAEAEHGARGFAVACKQGIDLIVSDVMMPQMDGFSFCKKLKSDGRTSHIPIILLTARAEMDDRLQGLETGADDYLTKPFYAQELLIRSKNLISQRHMLQSRFRTGLIINPAEITATSMDAAFLQKVMEVVEMHMDDTDFSTAGLARQVGYSRRQLNRKLRALTGQSVREFIRSVRLKRAARLLQKNSATVTEVMYQVGFNNPGYFARVFRQMFDVAPSVYRSSQYSDHL